MNSDQIDTAKRHDSAGRAVEELEALAHAHRAVRHPYLDALESGQLPDHGWAVADFAHHYLAYSSDFPTYVRATIAKLEAPHHRMVLESNVAEEQGRYDDEALDHLATLGVRADWIRDVPHPALFQRFVDAVTRGQPETTPDPTVMAWGRRLVELITQGSAARAIGALGLATELVVPSLYRHIVASLDHLPAIDGADTVFFVLHTEIDDGHGAALRGVAVDLAQNAQGRRDLRHGMLSALELRAAAWDRLLERAVGRLPPHHGGVS